MYLLKNRRILSLLAPPCLLLLIIYFQYSFDIDKKGRKPVPPVLIPAKALKLVDMGMHSSTASLMWLYTVQQVGTHPRELPKLIKTINAVDQKFSYPYAFGALVLSAVGFPDDAVSIAKDGIENSDPDWRIPYYLATTYHIFHKDRKNAAYYFDLAGTTPGAPDNIKAISARYGIDSHITQTKDIWRAIYENTGDEIIRERAKNYLLHLEITEVLEKAIETHRVRYGFIPSDLNELVNRKIIARVPESPLGVKFIIKDGEINVQ